MDANEKEEIKQRITELRAKAARVRDGSKYADSRQARDGDEQYARSLEDEARKFEYQLQQHEENS